MSNNKRQRLATTPQKTLTSCEFRSLNIPNATCTSCRRSLAQAYFILCSRCSATTCVVCSRTCDASGSSDYPPSNLSTSTPVPRRVALTVTSSNTNPPNSANNYSKCAVPGKRRKFTDDSANIADTGIGNFQENNANSPVTNVNVFRHIGYKTERQLHDNELSSGCGRVICRNCCFENSQNNAIACHDCRNGS
ncbi:hypothetical protein Agabi119p4_10114 [Agaricus bisporus var. burnettii]|uniref:B box-type domain-containing protein n=1 Tax=Agaricus bisporus var. burnettii TaxID=192524 RepID=A0A8H7EWM8_AGABI|nr:hypothetical protein Agabi119p4_10114 [Agaricus bisporus var. burnettii]